MKVTVSAHEHRYNGSPEPALARAYAKRPFTNGDDQSVAAGEIYSDHYVAEVAVTYADGVAQIAAFSGTNRLDSTIVPATGRVKSFYALTLHDANGNYLETVYDNIKIPESPTTTTWTELARVAESASINYRAEYYNREQITDLLANLSTASNANEVVIGKARLSVDPESLSDPVAVGDNDTRMVDNLANYGDSLASAVTAIGATESVLTINSLVIVSSNLTVPSNIKIDPQNGALFQIDAGATLTVGKMSDAGNTQIFELKGDTARVLFGAGAVSHINAAWFAGNDADADVTGAITQMIASAEYSGGNCQFYFPQIAPETEGGHDLDNVNSITIYGNGNSPSGASGYGTALRLKSGASASYIFKVGENRSSIRWRDITLYGNDVAATGVLFEGTGGSGTTSVDFSFTNVTFHSLTKGVDHHSLGDTWQLAQVGFYQCYWINCEKSFVANSVNGSYKFVNPYFQLPNYGIGLDIQSCGALTVESYEFAGSLKTVDFTSADVNTGTDTITKVSHGFTDLDEVQILSSGSLPTTSPINGLNSVVYIKRLDANSFKFSSTADGLTIINLTSGGSGTHTIYRRSSKVCVISGSHGAINFHSGGQDEACLTFVENNASDINGVINIDECLVQSKIQLNQSCQVNVHKSNIFCDTFQGSPSLAYVSIDDCNLSSISVIDGQTISPLRVSQMTGGGIVVKQNIARVGKFIQRFPNTVYTPKVFDGSADTPVQVFGYETDISESKNLLFVGRTDALGNPTFGHYFRRDYATGILEIYGNQAYPNNGIKFNGGSAVTKELSNGASLNFGSIAAHTTAELTITVTGAVTGNVAWASPETSIEAGLVWSAYVSATNTVTIRLLNGTASPIDPAAKNWTVWCRI